MPPLAPDDDEPLPAEPPADELELDEPALPEP